jgi:hypothetical protein
MYLNKYSTLSTQITICFFGCMILYYLTTLCFEASGPSSCGTMSDFSELYGLLFYMSVQ